MSDSEKTVSVKLNERWIERLDRLAKKGGLSRHQLMRNLIEVGMDAISIGKAVGLFQLGLMIRDMFDVQMKPEPGEEKPLPLKLDEKFLAKIDDVARRGDLTRHQLMRNLIHVGVEEVEAAARIGLFQASVWVR
ncbi:MAG: CopG family transcriptional regulator, partial [Desulfuromonadales bacterium]